MRAVLALTERLRLNLGNALQAPRTTTVPIAVQSSAEVPPSMVATLTQFSWWSASCPLLSLNGLANQLIRDALPATRPSMRVALTRPVDLQGSTPTPGNCGFVNRPVTKSRRRSASRRELRERG